MVDVGRSIREWRLRRGLSQSALAARANISSNMIGVYERGQSSPTLLLLERIAVAMDLTLEALLAGPDAAPPRSGDQERADGSEIIPVPFLETWDGGPAPEPPPAYWPVQRQALPHPDCLTTRVTGDALHPFLLAGDVVIVDHKVQQLASGDLVVVHHRGTTLFRRLINIRGRQTLEAYNHLYPSLPVTSELKLSGRIVGLVERVLNARTLINTTLPPVSR
jgi:transcriptional regulator with XRE-family HTH domain